MARKKDSTSKERQLLAKRVGNRIRDIRRQQGLSLEALALKCEMSPSFVGHIERGLRCPTLHSIECVCNGLGISMAEIFMDDPINMDAVATKRFALLTNDMTPEQIANLMKLIEDAVALMK